MDEETKCYEEEFVEIVDSIKHKRQRYYEDYEVEPPSKEKAL